MSEHARKRAPRSGEYARTTASSVRLWALCKKVASEARIHDAGRYIARELVSGFSLVDACVFLHGGTSFKSMGAASVDGVDHDVVPCADEVALFLRALTTRDVVLADVEATHRFTQRIVVPLCTPRGAFGVIACASQGGLATSQVEALDAAGWILGAILDGMRLREQFCDVHLSEPLASDRRLVPASFEGSLEAAWLLTPAGLVVDCNQTASELISVSAPAQMGTKFADAPCWSGPPSLLHETLRTAASGRIADAALLVRTPAGPRRVVVTLRPLLDSGGAVRAVLAEARVQASRSSAAPSSPALSEAVQRVAGASLFAVVTQVVQSARTMFGHPDVVLAVRDPITCSVPDPENLKAILLHLLSTMMEIGSRHARVTVSLRQTAEQSSITIHTTDADTLRSFFGPSTLRAFERGAPAPVSAHLPAIFFRSRDQLAACGSRLSLRHDASGFEVCVATPSAGAIHELDGDLV